MNSNSKRKTFNFFPTYLTSVNGTKSEQIENKKKKQLSEENPETIKKNCLTLYDFYINLPVQVKFKENKN